MPAAPPFQRWEQDALDGPRHAALPSSPPWRRGTPSLSPGRALLHPLWWSALVVLALSEHALEGAGRHPTALTGKLTDVASLLVAPVVLASLLGVSRPRGWLLAHLGVGAVFSAIKLSASAAGLWAALLGALGIPSRIRVDPTDLCALPVLLVSFVVFARSPVGRPAPDTGRPARRVVVAHALRRILLLAALVVGLRVSATPSPRDPEVRLCELEPTTALVCATVAEAPGHLAAEPDDAGGASGDLP